MSRCPPRIHTMEQSWYKVWYKGGLFGGEEESENLIVIDRPEQTERGAEKDRKKDRGKEREKDQPGTQGNREKRGQG